MKNKILKSVLIKKFFSGKVFEYYFRLWLEIGVRVRVGKILGFGNESIWGLGIFFGGN